MHAGIQLYFMQSGSFAEEMILPTIKMGLPTSVNIIKIIPHRLSQKLTLI